VRKKYDYVLIDTPTMGTVSDTMLISRSTAGVVVVVKRGSTTFDGIEKMLRSANRTGCEIIGAVCNF
jgi:Mrp family chromosome partitioning ATPase